MQDKDYFEGILNSVKLLTDLLMHGAIESSTDINNEVFIKAEQSILTIQHELFKVMEENKWYKMENIPKTQINQALKKQK